MSTLFDGFSKHSADDITLNDVESPVPQAQTVISTSKNDHWDEYDQRRSDSAEHILPLNKVHVRHDIRTT